MISKTGQHAVHALAYLANLRPEEFAGAGSLARAIDAPANYLAKLLQAMAHVGLLESRKGKGGGFRLARDPRQVMLYDVIEPIDHVSAWQGCLLGRGACDDAAPCGLHERWGSLREAYLSMLTETSIADIAASVEGFGPDTGGN